MVGPDGEMRPGNIFPDSAAESIIQPGRL